MSEVPYASVMGSLMYVVVCTRPDIAQAVGVISRYISNPGKVHWRVVKWILRYLKGSSDLCYDGTDVPLLGYVDSDFASDVDSRRSSTSYVLTLRSEAVSWVSWLQKIVALLTTEVVYVAAIKACKELIWLKNFLKELEKEQEAPSLHSDSQSAIDLANNLVYHGRTKHIDVRYHFICELLKDGMFSLLKMHTSQNLVDMLTKVVTVRKLKSCSTSMGLLSLRIRI